VTAVLTHAAPVRLVRDARSKSQGDFDALYAASCQRLTLQLFAYLGDLDEANDAVAEAFCRAFAKWKSIQRHDDPIAYVRRTAWDIAARSNRRITVQTTDVLVRALATLPANERRVVVLHFMAKLSVAEIAAQEGTNDSTITGRLARAKTALSTQLITLKGNN
jgi:RNA polymerase sigma-70 factor, ECF subfamily